MNGLGRLFGLVTLLVAGCSQAEDRAAPTTGIPTTDEALPRAPAARSVEITADCDAGDQAFARRTLLNLLGRRPASQAEVDAMVDVIAELRAPADGMSSRQPEQARRVVVAALLRGEHYRLRWSDFFKDSLRVARSQTKSSATCYGSSDEVVAVDASLARYVRDHEPTEQAPPLPGFRMKELLASALELDDLSVLYRANLFAMLGRPMTGNSNALELELARRNDFGAAFEAVYTGRDVTCLGCHNSETSVTFASDPLRNRFWPVPGLFERALFGSSFGTHPATEVASKGSDVLRARGMWRYDGVARASGVAPFGWGAGDCGVFAVPDQDDPLAIDTYFGTVRSSATSPKQGLRASVWDLERSLQRGVDALATRGLERAADGAIVDPDQAFAYLVALTLVEKVWTELIGSPLTVAHHFPRTEAQRNVLQGLTDAFVHDHFSLRRLLLDIALHPAFNLKPPAAGCGGSAYPLPRLFDPWTSSEVEPAERGNGPSDAVYPLSPRLLRRSLHASLGWPSYPEYPDPGSAEETLSLSLGFFLRDSEPGRRAFDFQGRLTWEAAYGPCTKLGTNDFISSLVARAQATATASIGDAVATLRDRLLGDARLDAAEQALIEQLFGMSLDSRDLSLLDAQLRRLCGNLVTSPWFMLGGVAPVDSRGAPRLTAAEDSYEASCQRLRGQLAATGVTTSIPCARQ